MRIAVNTRLLLKDKLEGIGWFEYETLKRITCQHPECEFVFLFDRKYDESFIFNDNITPIIIYPQARHPFFFFFWLEYSIRNILKAIKPDLFLSPDGYLPVNKISNINCRFLPVIHDLNFEHYPENLPFLTRKYNKYYFPKFAKCASRIATVSEFSKNDIISLYNIDENKIDVVFNGADEDFKPLDAAAKADTLKKYSDGKPYFVFIGSLHSRKNLTGLFKAYDLFRQKRDNIKLIIVGIKRWWTSDIETAYNSMQFKNDVVFTGRLDNNEVNNVLGTAIALVFPSFFEGFGIPIIEAFYCGTPVITSDVSSMPEVAGDAALLIDPFSPQSISNAMIQIVENDKLRNDLINKGFHRKLQFTWQKTADNLWTSIENSL